MIDVTVFDVEGDGLTPTKLHVLSWMNEGDEVKSTFNYNEMREVLSNPNNTLVGHNITQWDVPHVERLLGIKVKARLIDTMGLSWYLYPKRIRHGLDDWGTDLGIPKPKIDDWYSLTPEEYQHRCEEDVKINRLLWEKIVKDLMAIYGDWSEANRLIHYIQFKLDCAREQERSKWRLDKAKAQRHLAELIAERDKKLPDLKAAMPKVPKYQKKTRPAKPYKKDGSVSAVGKRWFDLLERKGKPRDFMGTLKVVTHYEEPNPSSHPQVKAWLFDLGWEPQFFKFKRDKETGNVRQIPQVKSERDDGTICDSVMALSDVEPSLVLLNGMGIINHRISFFESMLENEEDGFVYAGIAGLTNTLRFKHRAPNANIPGVSAAWGKEIRGCLIAREGYELCGSDQSSLEDRTKLHYMYQYDPEYVMEMSTEGFDPHLDLAKQAGELTQEQVESYTNAGDNYVGSDEYKRTKGLRQSFKVVNYSCVYGAGAATVARGAKCSESKAKKLVETYWKRNWSVKQIAEDCEVKTVNGQMWLKNPVSKFWYSLRHDKDRFSTLNQGTGVYAFDTWVKHVRNERPQMTAQFHDEIVLEIKKGHREECEALLRRAVDKTNDQLKLNRELDISIDFGDSYAEIH